MRRLMVSILIVLALVSCSFPIREADALKVSQKKLEGHIVVELRDVMNSSCYDDGIEGNGEGGWLDSGMNDFHTYPPLDFGAKLHRGYFFDFVDPATNNGKNLLMTGTDDVWPDMPRTVNLTGLKARGKFIFVMHSEPGIEDNDVQSGGKLKLQYADGGVAELDLRKGKELDRWFQGPWWDSYEEANADAPELLKESECDPTQFEKLGGQNFAETVLKYATAVRWPVTQGENAVSHSWDVPVAFWALKWKNPNPDKTITGISLESSGATVIGIAAITITDKDFSLDRQTLGKPQRPPEPPAGYFTSVWGENRELNQKLIEQIWTKGLWDVTLRSDRIVTLHVDHMARPRKFQDADSYVISSKDDPNFREGVHPVKISRFSKAARCRDIGPHQNRFYVDHWLHLEMPFPFQLGATYEVELVGDILPESDKLTRSMSFALDETPNPSFKLNQVGYSNAATKKLIYLSSYLGDGEPVDLEPFKTFEVRDAKTARKVYEGPIVKVSDRDPQGLDKLYVLDISDFRQEGKFYVWVDGLGRSYPFLNGDAAAEEMYRVSHTGIFFQRSGFEMKQPWAGKWERPMAHDKIYVTKDNLGSPPFDEGVEDPDDENSDYYVPDGPREIHGGHYDAGDYDLRPMHINVPELLMSLYEGCPKKFYDGQMNIPENHNGVPDILDEAAWNLLSLEYIQDYATEVQGLDGGVAPGMESYTHPVPGQGMGRDPLPYFMRKVSAYFSFSACAAFAQAARLFKPFDQERAARYLRRAERAYAYAVAHKDEPLGSLGQAGGQNASPNQFQSAWCWAAGQLYSTTGEREYLDAFLQRYKDARGGVAGSISRWGVLWGVMMTKRDVAPEVRQEMKEELLRAADRNVEWVEENGRKGYRAATPKGGGWGNTSGLVSNIEPAARAYLLTREQKYLDAVATSTDFSLGMNPSEMSWMTGAGSVYPMDPCNLNCTDDGVLEPHPGILIFGPTNYWESGQCILYPDKAKMGFYRRVVDGWLFIEGSEYTVWTPQAPFLFGVGMLLPDVE
ncbi:MAG: glycoside hydrolase family 9 protein [Planctomycetes bacterium]|nr:glycoside hydrolase family 9 protein [Planctomycetota bacterium]